MRNTSKWSSFLTGKKIWRVLSLFSSSCLIFTQDNQISSWPQQNVFVPPQAETLQSMYSFANIHFKIMDFKIKVLSPTISCVSVACSVRVPSSICNYPMNITQVVSSSVKLRKYRRQGTTRSKSSSLCTALIANRVD